MAKRWFDLAVAIPATALTLPVVAVAAAGVWIESRGAPFFVQRRVGRGRRLFSLVKIRTMSSLGGAGPSVTTSNDARVTRLGRVLRRTKIDELPQLWNVLRGDMSLVGPRPEVPRFTAVDTVNWSRLLSVRPGLTDAASIAFAGEELLLRDLADPEDAYVRVVLPAKARVSLAGMTNGSVRDDIALMLLTIRAVIFPSSPEHATVAQVRKDLVPFNRTGLQ